MSIARARARQAEAYLQFLYTTEAQAIFAKHHYRPFKPRGGRKEDLERLPRSSCSRSTTVSAAGTIGQKNNFDDGGIFDQI